MLARIAQNARLAAKYGIRTAIASGAMDAYGIRNPQDLINLATTWGMGK